MDNKMYLQDKKELLNNLENDKNTIYDECQTGPMEEPNLVKFDIDIDKFLDYQNKINTKRK